METDTTLIAETIALTEKKVAMALDDIIKLSKRNAYVNKGKNPRRQKKRNQNFNGAARNNTSSHHMNSLSAVRQGAVAKRRSNFQGNQFPVTTNIARKAGAAAPLSVRARAFNAGRMTSANHSRSRMLDTTPSLYIFENSDLKAFQKLIFPPGQNLSLHTKRHEVQEKVEKRGGEKKTLDSRFASMKEQRKSNNKKNYYSVGVQVPRLPPWARARIFPN